MTEGSTILDLSRNFPLSGNVAIPLQMSSGPGGDVPSASFPDFPSLLRAENRRFLMDRVDTTNLPDFSSLIDISFDHDIYVASDMISFDLISGFRIGGFQSDLTDIRSIESLDEDVDFAESYRMTGLDEIRFGNAFVWNRHEQDRKKRRMVDCMNIHPGNLVDYELSRKNNKPVWWVFYEKDDEGYANKKIAFVSPDNMKSFEMSAHSDAQVVGNTEDIVHFKGGAPKYQKYGVGITQVAKILIEAKLDMLVDFSKIIKREASPKEYLFVNTTGLSEENRKAKLQATIKEANKQRKLGSIMVMEMNETDMKMVGSEGKVLDNFSLHYRDDILRAIRILTRIPPSFWLGESTNKATINSQLLVYNAYLNSKRYYQSKKYRREIFAQYLRSNFGENIPMSRVPEILTNVVTIEDAMDKAVINDIYVRAGCKSRKQVSQEMGFRLPEEDNEPAPNLGGGGASSLIRDGAQKDSLGVSPLLNQL